VQDRNFIDAFAGEDAFAIEILISIGDGARIYVESRLAGIDGGQARAGSRMDTDTDTRLEYAVAFGDDASLRIDNARLSGCAIAPIIECAVPRGSCVSESRVMM